MISLSSTYDHRTQKTRHPVRSALDKLCTAGLVVGSVTTSESPVLYVFDFFAPNFPLIFLSLVLVSHFLSSRDADILFTITFIIHDPIIILQYLCTYKYDTNLRSQGAQVESDACS
ncbi:hypothetical protein F5B20DRAFT_432069 [Whalleya microplaca]|nr:hypothetical protein F5B20DRAFT_432069 [Whalleya microplaca]